MCRSNQKHPLTVEKHLFKKMHYVQKVSISREPRHIAKLLVVRRFFKQLLGLSAFVLQQLLTLSLLSKIVA